MQRICFLLQLNQDKIPEYMELHRFVWPEMLDALRSTGWKNYSLFLGPGGILVGYVEVEDFDKALEGMKALPVNERWQMFMQPFFASQEAADDAMSPLPMIFHLD
jgi:L-rhamnose mutarotase